MARLEGVREASRLIMREFATSETPDLVQDEKRFAMRICMAINKLERESLQELVDAIEPQRQGATRGELERRAIEAVMAGTEWLSTAEIGRIFNPKVINAHSTVNRWRANGRIFGIDHRGRKLYPAYVFDAGWRPLPTIKEILIALTGFSPFGIAPWFDSTSSALGGKRPREVVASDPDAVLAAAKAHQVGAFHG